MHLFDYAIQLLRGLVRALVASSGSVVRDREGRFRKRNGSRRHVVAYKLGAARRHARRRRIDTVDDACAQVSFHINV